ncbi:hypothetical protein FNV43_RR20574 [Rhamnella rubrinervis]|uniref:Uncharacterized protein n=1 Tax=Rhamnella rubrinervis TaxID=2594499 RepID=A0A8K0GUP8_9ROSA|nr:hypothetical protein FNV43_RR20574 [Rhamnella rubrinervis]
MLSRLLPKPSHFRYLTLVSSKLPSYPQPQFSSAPTNTTSTVPFRFFSANHNSGGGGGNNGKDQLDSGVWKLSGESDGKFDSLFGENSGKIPENDSGEADSWLKSKGGDGGDDWETAEGYKPWSLEEEEKSHLFDIGEDLQGVVGTEVESSSSNRWESEAKEEAKRLEEKEKELTAILEERDKEFTAILKGPNRAFGDLIAASGITDEMLDSLIALKDLEGVEGLPPLSEIEDLRYEKSTRKSSRAEMERQKQEEFAKARVRQVDEKGRAYGTGRRKCSVARVWIEPGDGKFLVNDKQFDVYFPMLDHRAALLRPFSETKTLGRWDVKCTVKGGGVSGQVGAIRLGISKALQNWEPDLRPALRSDSFATYCYKILLHKVGYSIREFFDWLGDFFRLWLGLARDASSVVVTT